VAAEVQGSGASGGGGGGGHVGDRLARGIDGLSLDGRSGGDGKAPDPHAAN
jgi:hypothetical protein